MSIDPEVIIMDEPNQNLDIESEKILAQLIMDQKKQKKTIILSLHDYNLAAKLADFIILLDKGKILYQGEKELFFDK
jgi:ABC-type multidrug transport system ATPase subunit